MDRLSNLTPGAKIVLGAALAFLVCSLFKWFTLDVGEPVRENMWNGLGILAGLFAIGLVWQAIRSRTLSSRSAAGPALVIAGLALLLVICTFILFIDKPSREVPSMDATPSSIDRTFWAWLGLALALVVAVGAWMNLVTASAGRTADGDPETRDTSASGSDSAMTGTRSRARRFLAWSPLRTASRPTCAARLACGSHTSPIADTDRHALPSRSFAAQMPGARVMRRV
jgi:hypothetical protein